MPRIIEQTGLAIPADVGFRLRARQTQHLHATAVRRAGRHDTPPESCDERCLEKTQSVNATQWVTVAAANVLARLMSRNHLKRLTKASATLG